MARIYQKGDRRYRYVYRVVTSQGVGVHSKDYARIGDCRRALGKIKTGWPDAEIQRVREILFPDNKVWARQYDLWRNGKWAEEWKVRQKEWGCETRGPYRVTGHLNAN